MGTPSRCVVVAAWLTVGSGATPSALALDYDQASTLASSARARAHTGGATAELEAQLGRSVTECTSGPEGAPCRAVLRFTLGTLAEYRADAEPAARARSLRDAIALYEAILTETPDHAPTLQSLAAIYVRLGDASRAETVLTEALRKHPEQDTLAVMLGDFYGKAKRWDDAVRAYAHGASVNSTAELPRRRMVESYVHLLPQRLADLSKFLTDVELTFPSVAELGYRAIIAQTYPADVPAAEAALLRLVSILAGTRRMTSESLDALPGGWVPVVELRRYVEIPNQMPQAPWWLGSTGHRHGLAEAALALGHQGALDADPRAAATRWEVGRKFAPDYDDYVSGQLRSFRVVRLDIQTALALHYFKFPSLDPGEQKFNDVIQDLFRTKAGAYAADDLPGIQRHHTILGTIFAQKKQWRPGRIDGAMFQLENALSTAANRDQRQGTEQPLPELRALFAEGLVATGDRNRARATYVDAAQAYLDTDGLRDADRMLAQARTLAQEGPAPEQARITELERILHTRQAITQAMGPKLDPPSGEYGFKTDGPHAWVFGQPLSSVPKEFLGRQRFKALSDLAERAHITGQVGLSDEFARRAFKTAVEDVQHLNGATDLVRIERIRQQATQQKVLDFKPLTVDRTETKAGTRPKSWVLNDAPGGRPAYVMVDADDLVAAQIVGELSREPEAARPDFRVRRGQVVLPAGANTEALKTRLEILPGVGGVVVAPSLPAPGPKRSQ